MSFSILLGGIGGIPFATSDENQRSGFWAFTLESGYLGYPGGIAYLYQGSVDWLFQRQGTEYLPFGVQYFESLSRIFGQFGVLLFSTIGLISTYKISLMLLASRAGATFALIIAGTSLLWVQQSHIVSVDLPFSAAAMFAVWMILRAQLSSDHSVKTWVLPAIAVGLAVGVRYQGGLLMLPMLIALSSREQFNTNLILKMSVLSVITLATFVISNPLIVLRLGDSIEWVRFEIAHSRNGHFGFTTDNAFVFHTLTSLLYGIGPIALILSVVGVVRIVMRAGVKRRVLLAFGSFPVALFIMIGISMLSFQRYALPLVPFVAILTAVGTLWIYQLVLERTSSRNFANVTLVLIILLILGGNVQSSIQLDRTLLRGDTRETLSHLVRGDVMASSRTLGNVFRVTRRDAPFAFGPFTEEPDYVIVLSGDWDRSLYHANHEKADQFNDLAEQLVSWPVIVISPFSRVRLEVPLSARSAYLSAYPDLGYREWSGDYIEIYARNTEAADDLMRDCEGLSPACEYRESGFYASRATPDAASWQRTLLTYGWLPEQP